MNPALPNHAMRLAALSACVLAMVVIAAGAQVPRLVKYSGVVSGMQGPITLRFAIYEDAVGDPPLWQEAQTIVLDEQGRYTVFLGASRPEGLPAELFSGGVARWLGVRVEDQAEQARVVIVSVPYAIKAGDADTLGGKPLAAFVLWDAPGRAGTAAAGAVVGVTSPPAVPLTAGSPGYLGVFTSATDLGNSIVFQRGSSVGINTATPEAAFHSAASSVPGAFFDVYSDALDALPVVHRAARGTPSAPAAVQTDDILGGIAVRGYAATGFTTGRGQVMFKAAEGWTDTANGTYLQFTTTPLGASSWVERMRIDWAGNVGVGTTTPVARLDVAGDIRTTSKIVFGDGTFLATAPTPSNAYIAGSGLTLTGNVFSVDFAGSGTAATVARSDHAHAYLPVTGGTLTGPITFAAGQAFPPATVQGDWTITGNLVLPVTTFSQATTAGVLKLGINPFLHGLGGVGNTFVGVLAGGAFETEPDTWVTGVGYRALYANTSGARNSGFGVSSLTSNTGGSDNSAFGYQSLDANTTGARNSGFGAGSLGAAATANDNSAFGYQSLDASTTGTRNAAFGAGSLGSAVTANDNSAFGYRALFLTTGNFNSAFGSYSLDTNSTGTSNSAFGYYALYGNATGYDNTGVGSSVLSATTNGHDNAALGFESLSRNTSGSYNTAAGAGAGGTIMTGSYNTFVGYAADATGNSLTNATAIGAYASVAASNTLVLGGTGSYASNVGINTANPDTRLQVVGDIKVGTTDSNGCVKNYAGTGIAGTCSSDVRLKTNIQPFAPVLDRLIRLEPVHFTWKAKEFPSYHFGPGTNAGLVAQAVEQVFPEMVATDENGYKMVNYAELPYLTLAGVRELKTQVDELKASHAANDEQLRTLLAQMAALTERLSRLEKARQQK
jgi:hypothetical protein